MLRVRVEIVPWGREELSEEIARLHIGNVGGSKHEGEYEVRLVDPKKELRLSDITSGNIGEVIGHFKLHRYGWYRNRLGLAARALKMLQAKRNVLKYLPPEEPFHNAPPYVKEPDALPQLHA